LWLVILPDKHFYCSHHLFFLLVSTVMLPFSTKMLKQSFLIPIIVICNSLGFGLSRHSDFHTCLNLYTWRSKKKDQRHKVEKKHCRLANNWLTHGSLHTMALLLDSSLSSTFYFILLLFTCVAVNSHIWHDMLELACSPVVAFNKHDYN